MSVDWSRELEHSWPMLLPESRSELATAVLPLTVAGGPVRVGIDQKSHRHLLIPLANGQTEPATDEVDGALVVRVRPISFAGSGLRFVDIHCSVPDLNPLFDEVLGSVLLAVAESGDEPGETAAKSVDLWRSLLMVRRQRLMSATAQMALFGELFVLGECFEGPIDPTNWRGPLLERHDIVLEQAAVEVKTTGPRSDAIEIHGIDQMEAPAGKRLLLAVVVVVEDAAGQSLPDLIDSIRQRSSDARVLDQRLAAAGFSADVADRFTATYVVEEIAVVPVDHTTPRLTRAHLHGELPVGVHGVTYRIELGVLAPSADRSPGALRRALEVA